MRSTLTEEVTLTLSKASCLVLFELLTRSYERWRENNPNDDSASPMFIEAVEYSQWVSIWQLEGSLERTLPELFSSDYEQLLSEARLLLTKLAG